MRVLVTGGAGYIGSHTAKALAKAGHEPLVLDNLSAGHRWAVKWGRLLDWDLADTEMLPQFLEKERVEAVLHFAASLLVGESVQNPRKYYWNNVVNTLRLLDAMLEAGVKRIVFSSSAAVYGNPQKVPIPEDHPKEPVNPYGETKLAMERALQWYGNAYGLKWVALRYFNAAGADPDGELGESHDPEAHIIPLTIKAALGQRPHVEIYGTDYPTPDGTAIRDYIHVTDLGTPTCARWNTLPTAAKAARSTLAPGMDTPCARSSIPWGKYLVAPCLSAKGPGARAIRRSWWPTRAMQVKFSVGSRSTPRWKPSSRMPGNGTQQGTRKSRTRPFRRFAP